MTFPTTRLGVKVEIAVNNVFTDITQYVYKQQVAITRGSADESSSSQPSSCSLLLDNRDGRFSPRNPTGPYYGGFGRNTTLLVSVLEGGPFLDVPGVGWAQTADSAQVSVTGDIDVRADATLRDWQGYEDNGQTELFAKFTTTGNQRSWQMGIADGLIKFEWSADGAATTAVFSTAAIVPDPSMRIAVRATLDVDNGAAGNTVTFYTAPTIDGPWKQLGDPVITAGTTSIFDSTAELRIGDSLGTISFTRPNGKIHAGQVYNGINGTVAANIIFANRTVGSTSFTAEDGLTWTTQGGASINNQYNRFRGEVTAWPARWETGGQDVWVNIDAKSLLRRYGQGTKPLQSTLRRRIPTETNLADYWPMEDGEKATSLYPATPGQPMRFTGDVQPFSHAGPDGSESLPTFNTGCTWFAPVRAKSPVATGYQAEWIVNLSQSTATYHTIQQLVGSGNVLTHRFQINNTGAQLTGFDRAGTSVYNQTVALTMTEHINHWVRWQFRAVQNGGNVDVTMLWIPIGGSGGQITFSYAGTVGRITALESPDSLHTDVSGLSWGHVAIINSASQSTIFNQADTGFFGENARDRFIRLTTEEGAPIQMAGDPVGTPDMGAQRPDQLLDLLQECADADRGILTDSRDDAGFSRFKFIHRSSLYNQTPRLILGYSTKGNIHAPLDPSDDDLYLRNQVTATRVNGSSAVVEQETGPLSTATPPSGVGVYDTELTINLKSDSRLIDYAGWEVHLGTWNEERYPTVLLKLHAAPSLIPNALFVEQGTRVRITNPPAWLPPGDVDLMVRGYEENLSQFEWSIELQCVPARAWDVNQLATGARAVQPEKLDTDGTILAEALTTTETDVDVVTTDYPTWIDSVSETPFSWTVGGERMLVATPGALSISNPFFGTDITGWGTQNCTNAFSTAFTHPQATGSLKVTPNGVSASGGPTSTMTAVGTVNPAGRYVASMWVYSPLGWSDLRPVIDFYDSAAAFISTGLGSATVVPAGVWTYIEFTSVAPALASRVIMRARFGNTPAATDVYYVWAARVSTVKSSAVYDEFGRTTVDGWGLADSAQAWTNTGGAAADFDVPTGFGTHTHPAVSTGHHSVITSPNTVSDLYCDITTAALSTGGSQFGGILARFTDLDNLYEARVEFTTANAVNLTIRKRVASVETQLGTFTMEYTHVATTMVRLRFYVSGSSLKAKIYRAGVDAEPPWNIEVTDTAITAAGSVGVKSVRAAANTNANAVFRFDNFELANPQTFTVVRSVDGIVKSHSAGASVNVTYPMVLAL